MTTNTRKLRRNGEGENYAYFGKRPDWLVVLGQHRDSDALDRSNFRVILADLRSRFPGTLGDGPDVDTETSSHWAVGWTEALIINPDNAELVAAAHEWLDRLEDYPVASEDDWSQLESDDADDAGMVYCDDCQEYRYLTLEPEGDDDGYMSCCEMCGKQIEL